MARIDAGAEFVDQRLFRSADYFLQTRERCEVSPPSISMNQVKCNRERVPGDFVGRLATADADAPAIVQQAFAVHEFINADTIARGLSAFAPEHVALAAGKIMLRRIRTLASERVSFAFETTLATRSFKPLLQGMQQSGYELHLIFLWLPNAAMAVDRVAIRVKRGGHSVPEEVIERRYERGLANFFNLYRPIADSWLMLDNSSDMAPRPIAWRNLGGPLQVVRSGPWNSLRERYEKDSFDQLSPKNG